VPKFGRKVPHLRCDLHTSFKVKWSKVRVTGGRGYNVSAEPDGHMLVDFWPRSTKRSLAHFAYVLVTISCRLKFHWTDQLYVV